MRGGKRVGELEGYLKGGEVRSLSELEREEKEVGESSGGEKEKEKEVNGLV